MTLISVCLICEVGKPKSLKRIAPGSQPPSPFSPWWIFTVLPPSQQLIKCHRRPQRRDLSPLPMPLEKHLILLSLPRPGSRREWGGSRASAVDRDRGRERENVCSPCEPPSSEEGPGSADMSPMPADRDTGPELGRPGGQIKSTVTQITLNYRRRNR